MKVAMETNGFKKMNHQSVRIFNRGVQDAQGVVEEMTSAGAGLMVFGGVEERDKNLGQTDKTRP